MAAIVLLGLGNVLQPVCEHSSVLQFPFASGRASADPSCMMHVYVDEGDNLMLQDACPVKGLAGGRPDALIFVPFPVYPDGHSGRRDP